MLHLLAILLPPLAVRICGRREQFRLNCLLTLLFWLPGMIHALWVVSELAPDDHARHVRRVRSARRRN